MVILWHHNLLLLLIVLGTPTGMPVGASGQSGDPLSLLGNLSAPPTTTVNQLSYPFSNLTTPPTTTLSQSSDPFGNLGNSMATGVTGSNQSNDPFAYLANISTAPAKIATNNNSLFAVTNPAPLISANTATPTAMPNYNFNDLVVPLETITPGGQSCEILFEI